MSSSTMLGGRLRDQHLAAVADRADPRGSVDGQPHVPLAGHVRLARVQADANPQLDAVGPGVARERPLNLGCRAHRVLGTGERHEERVALVVDLLSAVSREDVSQHTMVLFEQARVALAEGREQLGRALDVREEECRCRRRRLTHDGTTGRQAGLPSFGPSVSAFSWPPSTSV